MKISSIQQLRDVVVDRPDVLRLSCEVVGQPKPTFQWEKDSKLLQESARVTITEEGFVSTLEVTKSDFEDSGLYTCTAVNDFGRVSTSCIARVRGELYWIRVRVNSDSDNDDDDGNDNDNDGDDDDDDDGDDDDDDNDDDDDDDNSDNDDDDSWW